MEHEMVESMTEARREEILNLLKQNGTIRVAELSERFSISKVSIRKDLSYMEHKGQLRRVHGGAIPCEPPAHNIDFVARREISRKQKLSIARAAAELISDGESVVINIGSTTSYVVDQLKRKNNLFVITNAFPIAQQLEHFDNLTTFFLGGRIDRRAQITVGESVIEQLNKYSIDKVIMGADGVDPIYGVTSTHHVEDYIVHQMIARAKTRILVADASKLGKSALVRMADVSAFDVIVTNRCEEKNGIIRELEAAGLRVIQAD